MIVSSYLTLSLTENFPPFLQRINIVYDLHEPYASLLSHWSCSVLTAVVSTKYMTSQSIEATYRDLLYSRSITWLKIRLLVGGSVADHLCSYETALWCHPTSRLESSWKCVEVNGAFKFQTIQSLITQAFLVQRLRCPLEHPRLFHRFLLHSCSSLHVTHFSSRD